MKQYRIRYLFLFFLKNSMLLPAKLNTQYQPGEGKPFWKVESSGDGAALWRLFHGIFGAFAARSQTSTPGTGRGGIRQLVLGWWPWRGSREDFNKNFHGAYAEIWADLTISIVSGAVLWGTAFEWLRLIIPHWNWSPTFWGGETLPDKTRHKRTNDVTAVFLRWAMTSFQCRAPDPLWMVLASYGSSMRWRGESSVHWKRSFLINDLYRFISTEPIWFQQKARSPHWPRLLHVARLGSTSSGILREPQRGQGAEAQSTDSFGMA